MRVLAVDIGSSGVKAGLWAGREFVAHGRVGFATGFDGLKVEAPAGGILRAVERAARQVLRGAGKTGGVEAVAFCAFSSGVVVSDLRGEVRAGAITHQDRRSVAEARVLCDRLGEKWMLAHTGNLPYPGGIGSSTLAWLRRHEGAIFGGDYRVGQLSSLIAWKFTGEWVIDPSQAVFLGLWDIASKGWSERVCDAVGVKIGSLPRMVCADQVMGRLSGSAAHVLGLREGTPVVGGFVDASAAVIQTPMSAGQLVHNAGSTDVLAMCLGTPAPREGILTRPVGTGAGVFPERWLAVRTLAASGSALDWARRTLFREVGDAAWRRTLARACRRATQQLEAFVAKRGREHLPEPVCVPVFAGERAWIEQATGALFSGVTLGTQREDLLVAIVRGLVSWSVMDYKMLATIRRPERIVYATGGAGVLRNAMHRAWPQRHAYRDLNGDGLRGLVELARRAL